ncbi:MAG TPA: spore maturation protein A [Candidatus Caccousia avistercoris]|nr:spore maturation protein A [Candidatus Caccousia avistercoris]
MLNWIWAGMILVSLVCAAATGRMEALSAAVFSGSQRAVELTFAMAGAMAAWTGLLKVAEAGGLTALLNRALRPVVRRLFPRYETDSEAGRAICMNIAANLLGLGNAATPMGIAAMKAMARENGGGADRSMVRFVVLNTASLQLLPTTLGALRAASGSAAPFDILPAVWVTSALSLLAALAACYVLEKPHG